MATLKVTSKGQVTLRREVLEHLGARTGDRLSVELGPDGRVEVQKLSPAGGLPSLFGRLHRPGGPVLSVAQMSSIAADGWAGRDAGRRSGEVGQTADHHGAAADDAS